jgi:hypothetical protein
MNKQNPHTNELLAADAINTIGNREYRMHVGAFNMKQSIWYIYPELFQVPAPFYSDVQALPADNVDEAPSREAVAAKLTVLSGRERQEDETRQLTAEARQAVAAAHQHSPEALAA